MGASSIASGRRPSKLMMIARFISALEGRGVCVGGSVGSGVKVDVGIANEEAVCVGGEASVLVTVGGADAITGGCT